MQKTTIKNTKILVLAAFMTALSVVIGWVCKTYLTFGDGSVRVTFENIPVILSGIWLGPVLGCLVGASADVVSALLSGYSINPIITLGAASVGLVSGIVFKYVPMDKKIGWFKIWLSVFSAHCIGSVIIKSFGLYLYGYAVLMWIRIPLYIGIALAETYIIYILYNNKGVSSGIERLRRK